ncbi:unnamed protein product [Adineta ricciae]|uniref:Uncharacterized protein n=1 Tax=Adineta ricciae TaxID=249248 RepID=A0A814YQB9_ADIRI|nr:unnamed protein product [Adineta ricciae]
MSTVQRDPFFDDNDTTAIEQTPPVPAARRSLSNEGQPTETIEDPVEIPRPQSPAPPVEQPVPKQLESISEEILETKPPSRHSSLSSSSSSTSLSIPFEPDEESEEKETKTVPLVRSTADIDTQTDQVTVQNESVQTETLPDETLTSIKTRKVAILPESEDFDIPLAKVLLDQPILSALPIISFCHPFSMTSHATDVILAMPRHLMIIHNQNSISVHPWQQPFDSTSTILEIFWCPFLYKLLVTTVEENTLYIYDFISIIDTIRLRGYPLSIKHQSYTSQRTNSTYLLPPSLRHEPLPGVWSKTRFTKSNSLGIYYCYISERHYSCMLTRIDHNTRQHVKAIDCSGGSLNNHARVCAMGLSEDRVAIVLTNLIMTIYHAETLLGLRQINLSRWSVYSVQGVSAVVYLWKTWLVFDPIEKKVVGVAKRKRQFARMLPEPPTNACIMDNGTLALWLGYPGALVYHRIAE